MLFNKDICHSKISKIVQYFHGEMVKTPLRRFFLMPSPLFLIKLVLTLVQCENVTWLNEYLYGFVLLLHLLTSHRFSDYSDRDRLSLFCKNIPYDATEDEISSLFEGVKEVRIAKDRDSGNPRGYVTHLSM